MNNTNDYTVAGVIYKSAVLEEKQWRRKKENNHDVKLVDDLLKKVNALGFPYKYFVDITHRNNNDKELLHIVLPYIGLFNDEWFSASLVSVVGKKGCFFSTETIINHYNQLSIADKKKHFGFYDNALSRIKDKRYLNDYLKFLSTPDDAIKLPYTMIMLGKWQINEAKPYFFDYLNSNMLFLNSNIGDLVFTSIEALSYYIDTDGSILKALENKLLVGDKDLTKFTQKAIKRLKK